MDIQTLSLNQSPQPELRAGNAARKPVVQAQVQKTQQAQQKPEPSPLQLQQAVQSINRKLANSTALEFTLDKSTGRTVVKVMDKDSGDLIRQIPSDAALAIAESIGEFQKGLLLKQEV
jgi:flagellar protein FlaG